MARASVTLCAPLSVSSAGLTGSFRAAQEERVGPEVLFEVPSNLFERTCEIRVGWRRSFEQQGLGDGWIAALLEAVDAQLARMALIRFDMGRELDADGVERVLERAEEADASVIVSHTIASVRFGRPPSAETLEVLSAVLLGERLVNVFRASRSSCEHASTA